MKKRKLFISVMIPLTLTGVLIGLSQKGIPGALFGLLICVLLGVVVHDKMEGENCGE